MSRLAYSFIMFFSLMMISQSAKAEIHEVEHNLLSRMIKKLGGAKLTDEMALILSEKPFGVFKLKSAFDKANSYSVKICGVEGEQRHTRDEVDAVRHFIGASLLTAYFGKDFAFRLLTAHEHRTIGKLSAENYMDLLNNELGYAAGAHIPYITKTRWQSYAGGRKRRKVEYQVLNTSIEYFSELVFKQVEEGTLTVIESGSSLCANSNMYPNFE